jgi:AcrR family transcriptional regulator
VRTRLTPDETREQILCVAEELFRRLGYGKTAIADIASALNMSSANVYRFFPAKKDICEAICTKLLGQGVAVMREIAARDEPAAERIERAVLELHRFNKTHYTSERRVHDMVTAALEENWASIEAHFAIIVQLFAQMIEDGIARGEFPPQDAAVAALTLKNCLPSVMHPVLIAACGERDLENQAVRIARFAVAALRSAPALPAPVPAPVPFRAAAE